MDTNDMKPEDHDVLIELRADVKNLNTSVTQHMANTTKMFSELLHKIAGLDARVTTLEQKDKVSQGISESRVNLRRYVLEVVSVLGVVFTAWATYLLTHHK